MIVVGSISASSFFVHLGNSANYPVIDSSQDSDSDSMMDLVSYSASYAMMDSLPHQQSRMHYKEIIPSPFALASLFSV